MSRILDGLVFIVAGSVLIYVSVFARAELSMFQRVFLRCTGVVVILTIVFSWVRNLPNKRKE